MDSHSPSRHPNQTVDASALALEMLESLAAPEIELLIQTLADIELPDLKMLPRIFSIHSRVVWFLWCNKLMDYQEFMNRYSLLAEKQLRANAGESVDISSLETMRIKKLLLNEDAEYNVSHYMLQFRRWKRSLLAAHGNDLRF